MKKLITAVSFAALMAFPAMAQDSTTEQMKNSPPGRRRTQQRGDRPQGR